MVAIGAYALCHSKLAGDLAYFSILLKYVHQNVLE